MKIRRAYINDPPVNAFDPAQFAAPGVENAAFYAWVWNAPIDRKGICDRLDEMQRMGIHATYILPEPKTFRPAAIPTTMEPDYLTPPYFELYAFAVQEAERRGMRIWLYDEGGWPSGGACGRVLQENPQLAKHCLASRQVTVAAGESYIPAADALAAFAEDGHMVFCADGGAAAEAVFEKETPLKEYYARRCFFDAPGIPDYPDLMLRESCDAFLASTHEKYAPYLKDQLGKSMTAVFTDEAKAPGLVPFTKGIRERFKAEYGYSVLPYLPALEKWLQPDAPAPAPEAARAAVDFYELASRMLCENWLLPQKEWSNRHGLCFTGHMDRDDEPCAGMIGFCWHLLRALRCLDIPGIDVIWRQLWPGEPVFSVQGTQSNGFFPRYASSAAAQNGSPYVLTETAAIYGNGLTPEKMRWLLGYQAVRGVNRFNLNSFTHSTDGWLLGGALPSFREHNACYADLAPFNAWAQRLAWAASAGRRAADIALYQPVQDIWAGDTGMVRRFDAIGRALDACGAEFDIFDDDVLENAEPAALDCGEVRLHLARYRILVLPAGASLPPVTEAALRRFAAGGGRVYCVGGECTVPGAESIACVQQTFAHALPLSGDIAGIRVSRRELPDGELYIVFNEKDSAARFAAELPAGSRRLWAEDGRITAVESGELELRSGEVAIFLCGACAGQVPVQTVPTLTAMRPINGAWSIRPVKRLHLGEMKAETQYPDTPAQGIDLGDWRSAVGADFSGSCLYETAFELESVPADAVLELGDVKYTCEVCINGVPLGVKVMPPYRYTLPDGVLRQSNTLQVRVTNTAANEYGHTDTFDKWQPWQLSKESYFARELEQDRDAYESGLYGPVQLLY